MSRRDFLKGTAAAGAAAALPTIVPSTALGANAPSGRITMGCIGVGRMGRGDMQSFLGFGDVQIVAVCDVDANRAESARQLVDSRYAARSASGSYKGCAACGDFREIVARDDIDAVTVCTPDHWHALPAIAAARAGKDVFVQKALTRTIPEGRVLIDAVRRCGRILQVGSQQRSDARFRFACELVRTGRIGRVHTVKVGLPGDPSTTPQPPMPVPKELDYDLWLGPAPWAPYTERRVHPQKGFGRPGWLRISDYCCGMIAGWGSHHMDIAHWGMGTEYTGPVEIAGEGEFAPDGLWDVHGPFRIEYTYANGVKLICADNRKNKQGTLFEGTAGWVYVRRGFIDAEPKSLLRATIGPNEARLYHSSNHKGNFLECIRSRRQPVAPAEIGHRSNTACVLGDLAMRLGRKLKWDPERERFKDDDEANRRLEPPMRGPWSL